MGGGERDEYNELPAYEDETGGTVVAGVESPYSVNLESPVRLDAPPPLPIPTSPQAGAVTIEFTSPIRQQQQQRAAAAVERRQLRKVRVDGRTVLAARVIERNIADTSSIVRDFDPAPPTKRAAIARDRNAQTPDTFIYRPATGEHFAPALQKLFENLATRMMAAQRQQQQQTAELIAPTTPTAAAPVTVNEEPPSPIDAGGGYYAGGEIPSPEMFRGAEEPIAPLEEPTGIEPMITTAAAVESPIGHKLQEDFDEITGERRTSLIESQISTSPKQIESSQVSSQYTLTPYASWSDRTKKMYNYLSEKFDENDSDQLNYQQLIAGKRKETAAATFFELLVLKSRNKIDLIQDEPYSDIFITKTDDFVDISA